MPELPSHLYHSGEIDPALSSFLNERNTFSDQQTLLANNSTSEQLDSVRSIERESPEMADLFNRIRSRPGFAGWDTLSFGSTEGTMELRRELRAAGPAASHYIFDHINNDPSLAPDAERAGHRIYCYCKLLEYCTTSEDELELTKLLLDPRVANDADRSNKTILMDILRRVGSISSCAPLNEFAHYQSQNSNGNLITLRLDLNAVQYTLGYIYARGNIDDRIAIRRAQRDIAELARDNGLEAEPVVMPRSNVDDDQENYEYLFRDRFNQGITSLGNRSPFNEDSNDYHIEETEDAPEREVDEDEEIRDEVEQRLGYEVNERLDVLRNLHQIPNTEVVIPGLVETDPDKLAQKHKLELRENHPSRYGPTLGIEIEIREKVVLPPEVRGPDFDQRWQYMQKIRAEKYAPTQKAGIPAGADALWEFAHSPAHNPLTLSREVQWLIRHGLIPPERGRHSLHLTIGGITSTENAADYDDENNARDHSQAYLLGRALEATGWCTTGGRILRPVLANSYAWAHIKVILGSMKGIDRNLS